MGREASHEVGPVSLTSDAISLPRQRAYRDDNVEALKGGRMSFGLKVGIQASSWVHIAVLGIQFEAGRLGKLGWRARRSRPFTQCTVLFHVVIEQKSASSSQLTAWLKKVLLMTQAQVLPVGLSWCSSASTKQG